MINCERYGRGERQVGGCERAGKRGRGAAGGCARVSKRFWRVGFLMVSVMRRMKEPGVGSRLPLLAYWVADFPTFQLSDLSACREVGELAGRCRGGSRRGRARRWVRSGTGWRGRARVGRGTAGGVIAECRRAQQVAQEGGSVTGSALPPGWWGPTCQLFDMLAFQLSGFLGSWKAGGVD